MLRIWATTPATIASPLLPWAHCLPVGTRSSSAFSPADAHIMRLLLSPVIIIFGFYVITFQQGRSPTEPPYQLLFPTLFSFRLTSPWRLPVLLPDSYPWFWCSARHAKYDKDSLKLFWACCCCFCAVCVVFRSIKIKCRFALVYFGIVWLAVSSHFIGVKLVRLLCGFIRAN